MDLSTQFLPGAEKYYTAMQQRQNSLRSQSAVERLIDRANQVSIFDVLEDYFGLYLPREGQSYKSRCPFGEEHADGGLDKGWRTYPASNSSFCFPMHGYMTPTRLIQNLYREKAGKSAERILRNYDLLRPKYWKHRYQEMLIERENHTESVGNPQHAVAALDVALQAEPTYTRRQFDPDVMRAMEIVLERLDEVTSTGDPKKIREWYGQAKSIMLKIVRGEK